MEGRLRAPDAAPAARWWRTLPAARASGASRVALRCELCPHACTLRAGERGACRVRRNVDGRLQLTTDGRASRFRLAAVEQAALYHFHPGAPTLAFASAGCNLACVYCAHADAQNTRSPDTHAAPVSAEGIARAARAYGARLLSLSGGDPVASAEYALDAAIACRALGLKSVAATAGYIAPAAARELFPAFDAVNVGVKAFSEAGYRRICGGHLHPVLETLGLLRFETRCWLEISYVMVAGVNDTAAEIDALARWIGKELGADVPLHLSSLACGLHQNAPAPGASCHGAQLTRARQRALDAGLHYVYTDRPRDSEGATTFCPGCQAALIERGGQTPPRSELADDARCPYCRTPIAGYFGALHPPRRTPRAAVRLARR